MNAYAHHWPVDHPPLIIDSFAGGGGASTGIEMALGRSPDMAVNHNPAALALHAANHPQTLHLSENIYKVDPLEYVRGRHIGLAWFSPDCKHFSKAKGGKPVERNVRDLAWIIPGWVERIQDSGGRIDVVILENVEEFRDWGPLVETKKGLMPDPAARGQTFEKWCRTIRRLGGKLEWRELRACDFGAPTIRKRLFIVIRFDGEKIVWPQPTHAPLGVSRDGIVTAWAKGHGLTLGDLQGLKPYRTAAEIIDWSLPCPSIFDTTAQVFEKHGLRAVRPLAAATMSRVARGVDRYVLKSKKPFLVRTDMASAAGRNGVQDVDRPLNTIMTAGSFAAVTPVLAELGHAETAKNGSKRWGFGSKPVDEPLGTVTASGKSHAVIAPTLIQTGYGERNGQAARSLDIEAPLGTVVAGGVKHALAVPTLVGCGGRAAQSRPRGGDEPVATITAKADVCVTAAFLAQHNTGLVGHGADEPVSTIVNKGCTQGVVAAHLMNMKGSARADSAAEDPVPTICSSTVHAAVIAPHLMTMRNAQKPFSSPDKPTHTVTAGGAGLTVVAPFLQSYYGTGDGQRLDEPQRTVTTKDRFGYVEGEVATPPLSDAQLARAREVADFLREHGFWDSREFVTVEIHVPAEGRASDRMPSGQDAQSQDQPPAGGDTVRETYIIVDIGMRMLTPRELFCAQGFPPDYIIDLEFNGRPLPKSDQIACCGNSVSPPMAAALVAANCPQLVQYVEAAE